MSTWHRLLRARIKAPPELFTFIGPGLLVTVGFIDPGNWAANVAAGSSHGLTLLWMVTLSTIMLILLQHNAAHLGIASGLCLAEAATAHLAPWVSRSVLGSAMAAAMATAMAEILGGAVALNMLFGLPLKAGAVLLAGLVMTFLFLHSYGRIEKWIVAFVSLIGLCFIIELALVDIPWNRALTGWVKPDIPPGAMLIVMSVLGAVVMPHNLFLHSEIIQSRHWNLEDDRVIKRQLKYEFVDTLFSMLMGWAINSAMILVAAVVFFQAGLAVADLTQAQQLLRPLLGPLAAVVFALALLFAGVSSSVTAGMASGSIYAGLFRRSYDVRDCRTRIGIVLGLGLATLAIFFVSNPFQALIWSQALLSVQLPLTVFLQIRLTASRKVMGKYANTLLGNILLGVVAAVVVVLNGLLLVSLWRSWA